MSLEHIKSQQKIHILGLGGFRGVLTIRRPRRRKRHVVHDRDATGKVYVTDLQLRHVNASQNFARSDSHGHSGKARIDEIENATLLRALFAHNRRLSSAVDKGLKGLVVDLGFNVQHEDSSHTFRIFLHGLLVLLIDFLLSILLGEIFLGLCVVGVLLQAALKVVFLGAGLCEVEAAGNGRFNHVFSPYFDGSFVGLVLELSGQHGIVVVQFLEQVVVRLQELDHGLGVRVRFHRVGQRHSSVIQRGGIVVVVVPCVLRSRGGRRPHRRQQTGKVQAATRGRRRWCGRCHRSRLVDDDQVPVDDSGLFQRQRVTRKRSTILEQLQIVPLHSQQGLGKLHHFRQRHRRPHGNRLGLTRFDIAQCDHKVRHSVRIF
mmetsp:Transcript_60317/g.90901  ORF Transcript_60317/g.90901 Transcript_60317/m.90901 type:complete len:374 (+) Transcript_60317:257-1378(+)